MIKAFEDAAARGLADLVLARLVHAERQTVQQDHAHADPLKPRDVTSQGVSQTHLFIYLFIYYRNRKKKENRKIDRREQSTFTQITRNVREVTSSERVRQTY